ncbi:hypothetical protein IAQ61_004616 [Plenodomus lingam]|uniref:uncharacterized protein n=1 Tax=Leptosphaeria maculans TaxID=5022 RepID=UPI0033316E13|nr:hypothetical protein IAQ61_004616 [Plenodomus lingam]
MELILSRPEDNIPEDPRIIERRACLLAVLRLDRLGCEDGAGVHRRPLGVRQCKDPDLFVSLLAHRLRIGLRTTVVITRLLKILARATRVALLPISGYQMGKTQ